MPTVIKEQTPVTPVLATWHIRSKKDGLGLQDHSFPLRRNSIVGQGERVLLAGWREEDFIRQAKQVLACSRRSRKRDAGREVFFQKNLDQRR